MQQAPEAFLMQSFLIKRLLNTAGLQKSVEENSKKGRKKERKKNKNEETDGRKKQD